MYSKTLNKAEIYIDGCCRNSPGAGGYGYVILYEEITSEKNIRIPKTIEYSQAFWLTTTNRLEIMAAISAINDIIHGVQDQTFKNIGKFDLYSDSRYYYNVAYGGLLRHWAKNNWVSHVTGSKPKPVQNQDLLEELLALMDECAETGIIFNTHLLDRNSKYEFHGRAEHLAIAALTGSYDYYVSDAYYEKNCSLNFSRCYDFFGH